ncbi:estradiol 17-beta-dehydrogenase 8-like [Amphiura filiformis]|uniref:estradiol 17-beta-dehydrogenase 8-like n=1 Tax=Amphiura filiformis TaxID=82378 RepID=UPI003B21FDDC
MAAKLAGKVALVTGGGSGIGRAVCQLFAKHGAKVAVVDVNPKSAEETAQSLAQITNDTGSHSSYAVDISNHGAVVDLVKNIGEVYKAVPDVLVNSAGITNDDFMLKMEESKFDNVIAVNLKGTFLMTQAVSQAMTQAQTQNGAIVNIASIVGKVGNLGQCNYSASKAGVEGFTRTVAKELAKFGIRCNVVLPGFIATPMTAAVPDKVIEKFQGIIPLGRLGEPEDIADVCLFLASDQSSYITGASIEVTGGLYM